MIARYLVQTERVQTVSRKALLNLWVQVDATAHPLLVPIENNAQFQDALAFVAELWDEVPQDENSAYGSLFSIITKNIAEYEDTLQIIRDATPVQVLTYLMEEQQVTQKDIEDATGIYQSNLSQILAGKRQLTTEHVKLLSTHFKVNPSTLL